MSARIHAQMADLVAGATQWFIFRIDAERFAIRMEDLREVLKPQPFQAVPLAPPEVLGLLNLRGRILPVLNLPALLGHRTSHGSGRWLILQTSGGEVCAVVDDVEGVQDLAPERWLPAPEHLPPERWLPAPEHLPASQGGLVFGVFPAEGSLILGLHPESLWAEAPVE